MHPIKAVPPGAWDTHLHIFESDRFSFAAGRHFTPAPATLEQLRRFENSIGVEHVCIAHGLSYGADCRSLLYYLDAFEGKARGICVLDLDTVTDDLLDSYHEAGVRSVRLDFFKAKAMNDLDIQVQLIESTAARLEQWGKPNWSIQMQQPNLDYWERIRAVTKILPVPLVVDHFALIPGTTKQSTPPVERQGFSDLLGALSDGNTWIKISAPYRVSDKPDSYDDLEELVSALTKANPRRIIWGSDWPHTQRHEDRVGQKADDTEQFLKINDKGWIESLSRWLSEEEWHGMWVKNPCELYDHAA